MQRRFKPASRGNQDENAGWGQPDPIFDDAHGRDDFAPGDPGFDDAGVDYSDLDASDLDALESYEMAAEQNVPSLPIILFSAASGISGGVIALFISYRWLQWGVELSAGLATLALLFSLGISGAVLSAATGSRAAPVNILFSCGVILLTIFFLALCLLVGALVGTVLVRL